MEMTKKDYVDLIWDWAYDNLEFDTDNEVIYYTKSQKEDFIKSLYDNDWSKEDVKIFEKEIENFSYHYYKGTPDYYIDVEFELVEKNWKYQNIFEKSIDKLKEGLIKGEKKMNNNFLKLMVILLAIYTYYIYFIEGASKWF